MANSILLIEALACQRILLTSALGRARYRVRAVESGSAARRAIRDEAPDLVILGHQPDDTDASAKALSDAGSAGPTPILILDAKASPARRLEALRAGARDLLSRDSDLAYILARVRGLLREGAVLRERARRSQAAAALGLAEAATPFAGPPRRVALVTADGHPPPGFDQTGLPCLSVDAALDGDDGPVDAYCLAAYGGERDMMLDVLPDLRGRSHARHAAMLVLHDPADTPAGIAALNFGVDDLMPADGQQAELSWRLAALLSHKAERDALRRTSEASMRLSVTDPLTGVFNRRYAERYLSDAVREVRRAGRPCAVLMIDADRFKAINDVWGHEVGDHVLKAVVGDIQDDLRGSDMVARLGGEEFMVVLPATPQSLALSIAERIRCSIAASPVQVEAGAVPVTVSLGVAMILPDDPSTLSPDGSLRRADAALYEAKTGGRNRVVLAARRDPQPTVA